MTRLYVMRAKAGAGEDLARVLHDIVALVRPVPGCEGAEALRDTVDRDRFVLVERWKTEQAHRDAGPHLQRDLLPQLIAVLAGQPESGYFEPVASA